jgi:hypothetical protein
MCSPPLSSGQWVMTCHVKFCRKFHRKNKWRSVAILTCILVAKKIFGKLSLKLVLTEQFVLTKQWVYHWWENLTGRDSYRTWPKFSSPVVSSPSSLISSPSLSHTLTTVMLQYTLAVLFPDVNGRAENQ